MANGISNSIKLYRPSFKQDATPAATQQQSAAPAEMSLGKPKIGVITPPQAIPSVNLYKEVNDRYEKKKEAAKFSEGNDNKKAAALAPEQAEVGEKKSIGANVLSAVGLDKNSGKKSGFLKTVIILGLIAGAGFLLHKKINASKVSSLGITTSEGITDYLTDIVTTATKGRLRPQNLKKATIRTTDMEASSIKEILTTLAKIAREARNVDNVAPSIEFMLGQNGDDAAKALKEAFKNEGAGIPALTENVLKKVDSIRLRYNMKASGNDSYITTIISQLKPGVAGEKTASGRAVGLFKEIFS